MKNFATTRNVLVSIVFIAITGFLASSSVVSAEHPLMRFPDVSDNLIVFVHAEDIWTVPVTGGVATRITMNDGEEVYPKFSNDGKLIAFTGEYDGNADVYVMDVYGGNITRVTYHPGVDEVVGWHPTKNKIIFKSSRHSFSRFSRLYLISPDGTGLEELIMPEATNGSYSSDASKIAFNKITRENRTWKRYQGGLAQEIYLYDFETNNERNISNFKGTDRIPLWIGDNIYFSSDRDGVLNIYAYDTQTEQIEQITHHTDWDVRRPSMGGNRIIYELGGSLWLLDTSTKETKQVPIEIRSDDPEVRPYWTKVDDKITSIDCSPAGERALIDARGEVFTVPKEHGTTRNLTRSSGARDRGAVWSPDGKWIAYLSDKNGEYQIYVTDHKGETEPRQLTQYKDGYRHAMRWSPDSKKIAFTDQTLRLYILDVQSKNITEVDKAEFENVDVSLDKKPISDYNWSSDSRFIAYSKMNENRVYQVYIYSLETGNSHSVSNGIFNDFNPIFSKDGEHLIFISNRRFDPTLGDFEWEMVYKDVAGIYSLTLKKDGTPLFPLENDEVKQNQPKENEENQNNRVVIDFDGITNRVEAFPLPRGNYRHLETNESSLFYLNKEDGDFNRFEFRAVGPMNLYAFSFADRKEAEVIKSIDKYKISADGSKIVYQKRKNVGIIDASARESNGFEIDLSNLQMLLDPLAEWQQIFNESWRMERDFYYEPNMHGVDWLAMKEKYGQLMPYASSRQDVRFIIGELIGELNTSHTYVFGGDIQRHAQRVNVGMLGVDWQVDAKNSRYQFKKIYRVPDWTLDVISPLSKPNVNVNEGDYLLQVNGKEVTADKNVYSYFQNLANQQVTLLINDKPGKDGAKEIRVKPISREGTLRYRTWVEHNRQVADKESDGLIGYLHLPDTYLGSTREFPKYWYSQTQKKGLIIDGRFNGGGLDPDIFLRRLDRPVHAFWTRRYSHDQTIPEVVTRAHMVCLTNREAGSGGDMLPMEFRMREMGPIIGTRTWGGLVGVSMWISMIDGGGLSAPDYRIYDKNGNWIVENQGIQPDIVVDLDAQEVARGYDAQLMKGIELLMQKIKEDPRPWPKHQPYPVDEKAKK